MDKIIIRNETPKVTNKIDDQKTLESWGIYKKNIPGILEKFSLEKLQNDPWILFDNNILRYQECDNLFLNILKKDKYSERRKESYVTNFFNTYSLQTGEMYIEKNKFIKATLNDIRLKNFNVDAYIREKNDNVTSIKYYTYEEEIKQYVTQLFSQPNKIIDKSKLILEETLDVKQIDAIINALTYKISIITGYPGTGKTQIIKNIIANTTNQLLLTPTGIAARQVESRTGKKAQTIHKFLMNGITTQKNINYVIIDEFSMVDIEIFYKLLNFIYANKVNDTNIPSLILIGDVNQLPSIGPGQILKDLINSNKITTTYLTNIFRQDESNNIISVAKQILEKHYPVFRENCILIEKEEPEICDFILQFIKQNQLTQDNCKIIIPQKTGIIGTEKLNSLLQNYYNPTGLMVYQNRTKTFTLHVNDIVMQTKNNYEKKVFNGSIGIVLGSKLPGIINVKIDDEIIQYKTFEIMDQLILCYCMTCHKSQGKEFENVIIVAHSIHSYMLTKNLLYTAITRAKKKCFIIGDRAAINIALVNYKNKITFLNEL